ncbi:hypothetical protein [Viridibacillus arvi]|uniref:hypothetical protein n=1 Tax=Viridibacillus arvi TaxID=263475 RepID=UPI0034CE7E36
MENKQLLEEITARLKNQFIVPAAYTLHQKGNEIMDVHIFLHGISISHFSSMEYLLEMVEKETEDIRKVNVISDYLIDYFIRAIKEEEEVEAICEVKNNLAFVYEQQVHAIRWLNTETNEFKVSFVPFHPDTVITLSAEQLKREYNERFDSESSPDILVDLSKMYTLLTEEGQQAVVKFAQELNRNIEVQKIDECEEIQKILFR